MVGREPLVPGRSSWLGVASGAPVPCRRTFAQAIHGLRSLGCRLRFAILASLACNAGSHGTVAPSLPGG